MIGRTTPSMWGNQPSLGWPGFWDLSTTANCKKNQHCDYMTTRPVQLPRILVWYYQMLPGSQLTRLDIFHVSWAHVICCQVLKSSWYRTIISAYFYFVYSSAQLKEKTFQQIEEVNKSFTAVHDILSVKTKSQGVPDSKSMSTKMQARVKVSKYLCT